MADRFIDRIDIDAPDPFNALLATLHARSKDTPAKTFWHAEAMHPAIFRALRMDRAEEGAAYAAMAFRLHRAEDGARILFAWPSLHHLDHLEDDWTGIEAVLAWNPADDTATVMGDPAEALFGGLGGPTDALNIFASPFAYLRHIAEQRAAFWTFRRNALFGGWRAIDEKVDHPGLLALGPIDRIRWPIGAMPDDIRLHGIPAKAFNAALLRQARIPRATEALSMKVAA